MGEQPHRLLAGATPGERWVIRRRLAGGSATDLTGWLDALDDEAAHLTTADGTFHTVRRAAVVAARRAPAAAGGPHPGRIPAADLERHVRSGWPARRRPLGEWTLPAEADISPWGNSCHAVGDPGVPVAVAAAEIVRSAAELGIPPSAQVVAGSAEEQALRAAGWAETGAPSQVYAARLADLLGRILPDPRVRLTTHLDPDVWPSPSLPPAFDAGWARAHTAGQPPCAYAYVDSGAAVPLGMARGAVSQPWLGLTWLWVAEASRGAGWGGALVRRLGHWAARQGARYAYAQIATADAATAAACLRIGLVPHHRNLCLAPVTRAAPADQTQRTRSVGE